MATVGRSASRFSLIALVVALLLTGCGGDGDGAGSTTSDAASSAVETTTLQGDAAAPTAFCEAAPDPSSEVPESYVGSAEHVDDLQRLRDLAPDELIDDLDVIVGHFESEVDPGDPDSQLTDNFPDEVEGSARRVAAFIDEHCGK